MTKRFVFTLLVVLALTLGLSACRMPASKAPVGTPTLAEDFPFPVVTTQPDVIKDIQTQTAVASEAPTAAEQTSATPDSQVGGGVPSEKAVEEATATTAVEQAGGGVTENTTSSEPVVVPTTARPSSYVLQKGEWPICIARRFDLDLAGFFQANGLNMNSKPGTGTSLTVPSTGNWNSGARALKNHPASYTVQSGDTIYTVACAFGDVDPAAIIAVNHLSGTNTFLLLLGRLDGIDAARSCHR
jgi:LysM repeat protein